MWSMVRSIERWRWNFLGYTKHCLSTLFKSYCSLSSLNYTQLQKQYLSDADQELQKQLAWSIMVQVNFLSSRIGRDLIWLANLDLQVAETFAFGEADEDEDEDEVEDDEDEDEDAVEGEIEQNGQIEAEVLENEGTDQDDEPKDGSESEFEITSLKGLAYLDCCLTVCDASNIMNQHKSIKRVQVGTPRSVMSRPYLCYNSNSLPVKFLKPYKLGWVDHVSIIHVHGSLESLAYWNSSV